jgi:hypothetical protein
MKRLLLTALIALSSPALAQESSLPACENNIRDNCQGTETYANGDAVYFGEWKDGKLNGQGTYFFAEGGVYVGEFKDDKRHGKGAYTDAYGVKYIGEWKDGEITENGKYTAASNLPVCEGIFLENYWDNCVGSFSSGNGWTYFGEWKNNNRHGQGAIQLTNGDKYVGEFKDDNKHGQGTITFANGDKYVGEWKDGEITENGKYTAASTLPACTGEDSQFYNQCYGTIDLGFYTYTGEWINGKRTGRGAEEFSDGKSYIGQFKNGEKHGKGLAYLPNGITYTGEWKEGKRHGQGKMSLPGDSGYEGAWREDKPHGEGILTERGIITEGIYYKGNYVPAMCENNGFTKGTESFGQCILNYMDKIDNED